MTKTFTKENRIGALWSHRKKGLPVMYSGQLKLDGKTIRVGVLKNSYHDPKKRTPNYNVFILP